VTAGVIEGRLYICDATDDRVLRFVDSDGSSSWEPDSADELKVYFDDSSTAADFSVPSHLVVDENEIVYALDGGTLDTILAFQDRDGDGNANGDGEATVFYDNTADGPTLATPNTLLLLSDGSFLVADDGSRARHILRLTDRNNDGEALGENEAAVVFDAENLGGIAITDPESLAEGADGVIYVGDSTARAVFALRDLDGNGDYQGVGEARIFFQARDDQPFDDLDSIAVDARGDVYVGDEDHGTVWRLRDLNADGDAIDQDELSVFVSPAAAVPVGDLNDMLFLPGGELLMIDGSSDGVVIALDLNGDGDADDAGETVNWLRDGGASLTSPSGVAHFVLPTVEPSQDDFVRGDVDVSGLYDVSDAIATVIYLTQGVEPHDCLDALDANDDGAVNISDPIYTLNFLFLGGSAPPAPFPAAGDDPTPDELDCHFGV
jgi:sugar lactone lactonase YvrE